MCICIRPIDRMVKIVLWNSIMFRSSNVILDWLMTMISRVVMILSKPMNYIFSLWIVIMSRSSSIMMIISRSLIRWLSKSNSLQINRIGLEVDIGIFVEWVILILIWQNHCSILIESHKPKWIQNRCWLNSHLMIMMNHNQLYLLKGHYVIVTMDSWLIERNRKYKEW